MSILEALKDCGGGRGRLLTAVEAHAGGEEGRVIVGGAPDLAGNSVAEKAAYLRDHHDDLRLRMLREPRGYPVTCCNLVVPSHHPDAVAGYIIMEQTEYPPVSGSNTMCVAAALLKTGMVSSHEPSTEFSLEAPAGLVEVKAAVDRGRVADITVQNQPAFPVALDVPLDVPGLGNIRVDIAYGGMTFVIFEAASVGLSLVPTQGRDLVRVGEQVKATARAQLPVADDPRSIPEITVAQIWGPASSSNADYRNAVVVSTDIPSVGEPASWWGILDRSPCGTGICARMAVLHARGELAPGQELVAESVIGTTFAGRIVDTTMVCGQPAIIPEIAGRAWITGITRYLVDPDDPFPNGFTVGDIW